MKCDHLSGNAHPCHHLSLVLPIRMFLGDRSSDYFRAFLCRELLRPSGVLPTDRDLWLDRFLGVSSFGQRGWTGPCRVRWMVLTFSLGCGFGYRELSLHVQLGTFCLLPRCRPRTASEECVSVSSNHLFRLRLNCQYRQPSLLAQIPTTVCLSLWRLPLHHFRRRRCQGVRLGSLWSRGSSGFCASASNSRIRFRAACSASILTNSSRCPNANSS